jgi:hypothetical protein
LNDVSRPSAPRANLVHIDPHSNYGGSFEDFVERYGAADMAEVRTLRRLERFIALRL